MGVVPGVGDDLLLAASGIVLLVTFLMASSMCRRRRPSPAALGQPDPLSKSFKSVQKNKLDPLDLQEMLTCSICLSTFENACETYISCSHAFCASCLLACWKRTGTAQPAVCPLDRKPIRFIVPSLVLRSICESLPNAPADVNESANPLASSAALDREIERYNSRFLSTSKLHPLLATVINTILALLD